jgi:hypothetical protein
MSSLSAVHPYLGVGGELGIIANGVTIEGGGCRLVAGGSCVVSPNFPDDYPDDSVCLITGVPRVPLWVAAFEVELGYDNVVINEIEYSGLGLGYGPDSVVPEDGTIRWSSDGIVRAGGWALCWVGRPPAPPMPPLLPLPPPLSPLYPPLPSKFEVGAEICAVIDSPPELFDAHKFQTGIARAFGVFRPLLYGLRVGSCRCASPRDCILVPVLCVPRSRFAVALSLDQHAPAWLFSRL